MSDEERALWNGLARSIKPLRQPAKSARTRQGSTAEPAARAPAAESAPPSRLPAREASVAKSPPLAPLERRLKQRVARGRDPIDRRLDLHGLTQTEAHAALLRFLRGAQEDGARMVLIVTGKGSSGRGAMLERGVLKRQVPMWLALPEFRPFVVGFDDAHVGHGGQGALYVRLRRGISR